MWCRYMDVKWIAESLMFRTNGIQFHIMYYDGKNSLFSFDNHVPIVSRFFVARFPRGEISTEVAKALFKSES